jgi:DNA repair exonuclease SbcCD ATPase subunit
LVSGPNGSGKSTIIEALELCFFGGRNEDNLLPYVNRQLVDEIEVDERVSAEISVEIFDSDNSETIRVSRKISTLKTPTGKKDVIEDPVVEDQSEGGEWETIQNPNEYLRELIPADVRPFSFYDPEQTLGLDTWEEGHSYQELVERARKLRNYAAHGMELDDSASVDVSREYLRSVNQSLSKMETQLAVDESEEYLTLDSLKSEGSLISAGEKSLVSFALILAAGELEGVDAPVIMDMPFARVDDETIDIMCDLLRDASKRQVIIVGNQHSVDQVMDELGNVVASYHFLSAHDDGTARVGKKI